MLLVLYVGTQLVSGMFMSVTADKSQRTMMFVLPLIFVPFIISFPAGLILYWITTNIWTIGQQFVIQKMIPAPVAATPEGAARSRRHETAASAAAKKEEAALRRGLALSARFLAHRRGLRGRLRGLGLRRTCG